MLKTVILFLSFLVGMTAKVAFCEDMTVVDKPNTEKKNDFYISNGKHLSPSFFVKLPAGSVKPQGWLRRQLTLQAEGLCGRLHEFSRWIQGLGPDEGSKSAWLNPAGKGVAGSDEIPYWIRAVSRTAYALDDPRLIDLSGKWLQAIMANQQPDGYLGAAAYRSGWYGKGPLPALYPPQMVLNALEGYYEYTGDQQVLEVLLKYYKWLLSLPNEKFLGPSKPVDGYFFHADRSVENLSSVYWLYNRTGEPWLIELGTKIFTNSNPWYLGLPSLHGVNMSQAFRLAGVYHQQMYNDFKGMGFESNVYLDATEHTYQLIFQHWGQVPGGMYGADEGAIDYRFGPRQGVETCAIVEFMKSCEELLLISGDTKWADRCENATFNTLPASLTADLKALHYITAPNLILCDRSSKNSCFGNTGPLVVYDPSEEAYRCCLHNFGMGWPYYNEHLWLASPDNGLAGVLYGPAEVTAKVGDNGQKVTLRQTTRYPFEETIEIDVETTQPVEFPLYLRVPGWCDRATVSLNGTPLDLTSRPSSYFRIQRRWSDGDRVKVHLHMPLTLTTWKKNKDCVSINRGPLTFSLKVEEEYVRDGGSDQWPAWEVRPQSPWNYGLVLDDRDPAAQFVVSKTSWPADDQPFKYDRAPIELRAKAARIPEWTADETGAVGHIPPSPVKVSSVDEEITLIPMGCARLRISAFPQIARE